MRHWPGLPIVTLVLLGLLTGCRPGTEQTTSAPPTTAPPGGGPPAATATALGTAQTAGHFQVTLSTDLAAPKAGDTRFRATVTHDGQPVTDATVTVSLSMPSMTMTGPEVTLKPSGAGEYEGTGNLSMAGEWHAKATVSAAGETGAVTYQFSAGKGG